MKSNLIDLPSMSLLEKWDKMWDLLEVDKIKKSREYPVKVIEASKIWAELKQDKEFLDYVYEGIKSSKIRETLKGLDKLYEDNKNKLALDPEKLMTMYEKR